MAAERLGLKMKPKKVGKHSGILFVCALPRSPVGDEGVGGWGEGEEDTRGTDAKGSALYSLDEVLLLFFGVRVVALSVDDGRVGVGCVVRPFGLVCQIRSWGGGETRKKKLTLLIYLRQRCAVQ